MRVYVLGAGVSKTVNYPLGSELFEEIDRYVRGSGPVWNRFDYQKDWPRFLRWLETSDNPVIKEAYARKHLEHLFTVLDHARMIRVGVLEGAFHAMKMGEAMAAKEQTSYLERYKNTQQYQEYRQILLWALEAYFHFRHHYDHTESKTSDWSQLSAFGRKLCPGDVVITFNYDSTLARVLWEQGKWTPSDGYGFKLAFQKSAYEKTPTEFPESQITILHLHGAYGWYEKPAFRSDYPLSESGGAIPREALTPAPLETPISLDPLFLNELGIPAVDASLPNRPPDQLQILLHPSFFKNYELDGGSTVFIKLWRKAGEILREADQIFVIGYSLPEADSAALTLFLTSCDPNKVRIVNRNKSVCRRLRQLLSKTEHWLAAPVSFENWLRDEN